VQPQWSIPTFIDARSLSNGEAIDADVCIVGAGAAGITLARALKDEPIRVVVLESGGLNFQLETQQLYEGTNVGLPYFSLMESRLRYFGGTTNHWGGWCRPFDEYDFAPHPGVPNTGWPIGLGDVAPYYPEAAAICGLPSQTWELDEWQRRSPHDPIPLDGGPIETRVAQIVQPSERRFAERYRSEIESIPSVRVFLHASVVDIELADALNEVVRLGVATLNGPSFSVSARSYVLATGGIENARLLLASNRQLPGGVGNGEGIVGRFFLEHPRFIGARIQPLDERLRPAMYEAHSIGDSRITAYLAVDRERQRADGLVDVELRLATVYPPYFERTRTSADSEALRALVNAIRRRRINGASMGDAERVLDDLTSWRRFFVPGAPLPIPQPALVELAGRASDSELEALIPEFFGDIAVLGFGRVTDGIPIEAIEVSPRIDPAPNPDSRVTLGDERDANGVPRARLNWQLSRIDRDSLDATLEILASELGRTGLGRLQTVLDPGDSWPEDLAGGYHHMGTTRMSDDPKRGVVDANSRVHGLSNLYVAGSSVFATGSAATPTMTLVALTLRLADHIRANFT